MAIEEHYKFLQRRIARCGCIDSLYVIWAYSQFLQVRNFCFPGNIEKHANFFADNRLDYLIHEWELETSTEVVLHAERGTKTMRDWSVLETIVQKLRNFENELYGDNGDADIFIEMARIMHRQVSWQQFRPHTKLLYRYYRIFSDHAVDAICRRVLGLSVDALYCQAIWAYVEFARRPVLKLGDCTTRDAQLLLQFAARPLTELRRLIATAHRLDHSYAYQVGPLRQFPFVTVEADAQQYVLCPLPTLFFWRFTSGLYFDLIRGDCEFGNALGGSFERHVGEILSAALTSPSLRHVGQERYGSKQAPKATCDWLLIEGQTAAAFIECKTKRIRVAAKTAMGDLTPLQEDIGILADAVVQLYERLRDYEAGKFPNLAHVPARKCYPVVVTLEEWYLFGQRIVALLRDAVEARMRTTGLDLSWLSRAPYSVMSADEFEDAVQIMNIVGVTNCFEGKLSDPEMSSWSFGSYLRHHFAKEWKSRKYLFRDETEDMFNRLADQAAEGAGA